MSEQNFISNTYFSAEQTVRMTRLKQIREAWELFTATRKLMEQRTVNKSPDIERYVNRNQQI